MDLSLKNKNAFVCGSTQGIGKAIAMELAHLGANITLIARNEDKLKTVLKELPNNQQHDYIVADFADYTAVKNNVNRYLLKTNKTVHILINNTGGPAGGLIEEANEDAFQNAFSAHLLCNHVLMQAVKEKMKQAGYGRIINIISTSVKQPLNGLGVSNTIRGAVANWSKTLANELGQFGITVNNVLPGATNTVRLESIVGNKSEKTGKSADVLFQEMANEVPLKRIAQPEEVANAVAFLASPAAAYINGINLPVDGGRTKSL